jgi:hypothetical protein
MNFFAITTFYQTAQHKFNQTIQQAFFPGNHKSLSTIDHE